MEQIGEVYERLAALERQTVRSVNEEAIRWACDVTGVDYLLDPPRELPARVDGERFEVVITLMAHARAERIRLRVQVPESDPMCPSLVGLHAGAEANERETYDMFGIVFDGHPDPSRILMPEGWDGHPLRKDDGVGAIPVQFKGAGREVRP
jgi:NADH-quinone oxidoreductase subunit C